MGLWGNGDTFDLTVWDDEGGIDPNARIDSGIGQMLTAAFTQQLSGTSRVESNETGTRFILTIPKGLSTPVDANAAG